jgi:hypothetical protein
MKQKRREHGEPTGLGGGEVNVLIDRNMAAGIPAAHAIDLKNFERMQDMDEDSRLAASL